MFLDWKPIVENLEIDKYLETFEYENEINLNFSVISENKLRPPELMSVAIQNINSAITQTVKFKYTPFKHRKGK